MKWKKNIITQYENGDVMRYEWVNNKYTVDVSMNQNKDQGYPGSNQVNIYRNDFGGWILGTPRNFETKKQASNFVLYAKKKLDRGETGEEVAFPE